MGGSILLASTLVFTLKSQASSIIPHVGRSIGDVYQDITNTDAEHGGMSFDDAYQNAQKQSWQTGQWGTSKYYIDNHNNMHVGSGHLQGSLYDVIGEQAASQLRTLSFDEPAQAPQDSTRLLSAAHYGGTNNSLEQFHNIDNLDTSQVSSMYSMFADDNGLTSLDLSHWNTQKVGSTFTMFNADTNLRQVDLSHWDTANLHTMGWMFYRTTSLSSLDLSSWDAHDVDMSSLFVSNNNLRSLDLSGIHNNSNNETMLVDTNNVNRLVLGSDMPLNRSSGIPNASWGNSNQSLNSSGLEDGNSHPGTWMKQ